MRSRTARVAIIVSALTSVATAAALVTTGASATPGTGGGTGPDRLIHGSPGAGDSLFPHAGNGGYDVRHYGLTLRYSPTDGVLHGIDRIRLRTHQPLDTFNLDLSRLHVDSVRVDGGTAHWRRSGTELRVAPGHRLARATTHLVVIRYHGRPHTWIDQDGSEDGWIQTPDGADAVNEPLGAMTWFPVNNTPADKASYDLSITVPRGLTGISNGRLRSHRSHAGLTTWVWRERDQMASYLVTATIGRFRMITGRGPRGVPIRSFVDPSMAGAAAVAHRVAGVLRVWSRDFGPYPFSSAGIIIDRADYGYALEVQTRPVFPFVPDQSTLVHELAHQWYGDSVGLRDWSDIWLNEGFATYAEWLWRARSHPGAPHRILRRLYRDNGPHSSLWSPPPGRPGSGAHLFGTPVYARGAMALQVLRERIGTPDFFTVLRTWARQHRQGHGTTAQLRRLAARVSGQRLGSVFWTWIYHDGKPARL
ncbi:MAG: M1 family metallopeptidase [Nocardioidaceae bacterium]